MGDHGLGPVPESVAGRLGCGHVVISINPVIVVESLEGAFVQVRREVCVAAVVDWDEKVFRTNAEHIFKLRGAGG
jgi:hypothetical protein